MKIKKQQQQKATKSKLARSFVCVGFICVQRLFSLCVSLQFYFFSFHFLVRFYNFEIIILLEFFFCCILFIKFIENIEQFFLHLEGIKNGKLETKIEDELKM